MTKFALRRNRFTASALAVGLLAIGGFATHMTSSPDTNSHSLCMRSCP